MNITKEYVEKLKYYFNLCFGLFCLLENNFDEYKKTTYIKKESFKMNENLYKLLLEKKIIDDNRDIIFINWDLYRKYRNEVNEYFDKDKIIELREQARTWYHENNNII